MKVNGTSNWSETEAGQQLQATLTSEKTLKALDHLLQRIDTLEKGVERLSALLEQGPGLISMAADIADDGYRRAAAHGIDIEERLSNALHLAEKLTAPEMMEQLSSLLKLASQAPGIIAMAVDVVDEGYRRVAGNGFDLAALSQKGLTVARRTADLVDSEEFEALLHSDLFNPKTLDVLSVVSGALTRCRMDPPKKAGVFKLLGALGDPEIQKSLGFLLSFARNFGRLCNEVVERDLQNNKKQ